jgi:RNA polymerase sigma-70 factor (ECF subfamily)
MVLRADDVHLVRDRDLVVRFQAGDQQAFEDLYRRYRRRLERFCAQRLGDRHEAEEVAQEALVRAYRAMPNLAGERRFYPWVTVIAARLCVDTHRRRARSQPVAEIDLGPVDGGQEAVIDAVDLALLNDALGQLSPRHRDVLRLRESEEWSYQRIADHYDVSLGTVEALLLRARRSLRRKFLALAGPDATRSAVPAGPVVLAWAAHRLAGARHWLGALPGGGIAQLAAGGAATVAIGGAATLGVGVAGYGPAASAPAPPVVIAAPAGPSAAPRVKAASVTAATPGRSTPGALPAAAKASPGPGAGPTTASTAAVPAVPPLPALDLLIQQAAVDLAPSPIQVDVPGVAHIRVDPRQVTGRLRDTLRHREG